MSNPFTPPRQTTRERENTTRFTWLAVAIGVMSVVAISMDAPGVIAAFSRTLSITVWVDSIHIPVFLASACIILYVESIGRRRSMLLSLITLIPLAYLTIEIIYRFFLGISYHLQLEWILKHPAPVLGWAIACAFWCYFVRAGRRALALLRSSSIV